MRYNEEEEICAGTCLDNIAASNHIGWEHYIWKILAVDVVSVDNLCELSAFNLYKKKPERCHVTTVLQS